MLTETSDEMSCAIESAMVSDIVQGQSCLPEQMHGLLEPCLGQVFMWCGVHVLFKEAQEIKRTEINAGSNLIE